MVITTNGEHHAGVWGELMTVAATARGVTGVVIDGLVRDVDPIERLGFPVFARGASPLDCAGRLEVRAHGEPIVCGPRHRTHQRLPARRPHGGCGHPTRRHR